MHNKSKFSWIKELKKIINNQNIPEIQLDDNLLKQLKLKINSKNVTEIKKYITELSNGIQCLAVVKVINNEFLIDGIAGKLPVFNQDTSSLKNGEIIICTLEYTMVTESFNICNFEKIEFEKIPIIKNFYNNLNKKTFFKKIDYVLETMGLNSNSLMLREKLAYILRLIPTIIELYGIIEFSEGAIGKTSTYRNLNNIYIADSDETVATLIYNQQSKQTGIITSYDALVLDETHKRTSDDKIFSNLQKFLETGELPRKTGPKHIYSTSIVLIGNAKLDKKIDYPDLFLSPRESLFKNHTTIPNELIDRINFILPSWGSRAFSKSFLTETNNPFLLSMILKNLRISSLTNEQNEILEKLENHYNLKNLSHRANSSILKTAKGFIKLLNLNTEEDIEYAIYFATEGRFLTDIMNRDEKQFSQNKKNYNEILNEYIYESIILNYLDISEEHIINFTPHEVFYKSEEDDTIHLRALDVIGLKEINLLKNYSKKLKKSKESFDLSLSLKSENKLKSFYNDIIEEINEEAESIEYRLDSLNYLFGYDITCANEFALLRNLAYENPIPLCNNCGKKLSINNDNRYYCKKCTHSKNNPYIKEYFNNLTFL